MCENAARAETTESNERGRRRVASVVARMIEGGREATDRVRRKGRQMGSGKRQREGEGGGSEAVSCQVPMPAATFIFLLRSKTQSQWLIAE